MWGTLLLWLWEGRSFVRGIFQVLVAVSGLALTLGGLLWGFVEAAGGLEAVAASIDGVNAWIASMPIGGAMNMVNRVVPLNEILVLEGILLGVSLLALVVRIAKSWLPSIN